MPFDLTYHNHFSRGGTSVFRRHRSARIVRDPHDFTQELGLDKLYIGRMKVLKTMTNNSVLYSSPLSWIRGIEYEQKSQNNNDWKVLTEFKRGFFTGKASDIKEKKNFCEYEFGLKCIKCGKNMNKNALLKPFKSSLLCFNCNNESWDEFSPTPNFTAETQTYKKKTQNSTVFKGELPHALPNKKWWKQSLEDREYPLVEIRNLIS